jgi:predicted tellurium resistance membrane protein TerC
MGLVASFVARLLGRFPWLAWVGIAIVAYVAAVMIHDGASQVVQHYRL